MLAHLADAAVPKGWRVEILIIDNGSSGDTKAVALAARLNKFEALPLRASQGERESVPDCAAHRESSRSPGKDAVGDRKFGAAGRSG